MWFCPRCGHRKPSPLSDCVSCANGGVSTSSKRCPGCAAELSSPAVLGRLTCAACGMNFGDYEGWVAQCRAAAYTAHPAPSAPPVFQPGPPPPTLRPMAFGFFACALLDLLALIAYPELAAPFVPLAALQAVAGALLLRGGPAAATWALLAAGFGALLPPFLVPALFYMWVFHALARKDAADHFGPPEPATPSARARTLGLLFAAALVALLTHAFVVRPALREAFAWREPLDGALAWAADVLRFYWRHTVWLLGGGFAFFVCLDALGRLRGRAFHRAAAFAILALLALGPAFAPAAIAFRAEARKAAEISRVVKIDDLLWALREPDAKKRFAAARRLAELGRDARTAVPALEKALEDVDSRVRVAAALALAVVRPSSERAVAVLAEALRDDREDVDVLLTALLRFGPRARPALERLPSTLPPKAAALAAEIGSPAVPALLAALRRPEAETRRRALEALRRLGPDARAAAGAVEGALKDVDPSVAAEAARALGEIQREKALPVLRELLAGPLKAGAGEALCALGERDGLSGLPRPGAYLNALRRPAQWDHLRRLPIDEDLEGTCGEILDDVALRAVMCVEPAPGVSLTELRRVDAATRKRSALDALRALDVPFVLEEDRIRVLTPEQEREFWTKWLYEALADRSR